MSLANIEKVIERMTHDELLGRRSLGPADREVIERMKGYAERNITPEGKMWVEYLEKVLANDFPPEPTEVNSSA
jgi:hypothetical protein